MRLLFALAGTLTVGLACADGPTAVPPRAGEVASGPIAAQGAPRKRGKARRGPAPARPAAEDPQAKVPATGVPDPLAGLSDAQVCASDTLLMVRWSFDELQDGKCAEACCRADPAHRCCALDWPFSDVPPCSAWGDLRNELYARYGFPFREPRWQERFAAAPYYTRREDFDDAWMSDPARANAQRLSDLEDAGVSCTP